MSSYRLQLESVSAAVSKVGRKIPLREFKGGIYWYFPA